jgi:nucleoid-associated protein YgaU
MGSVFALRLGDGRYLPLLSPDRPVRVTRLFTTLADGQRKAIFHFYFRRRAAGGWRPIGRIEWEALPPSRAGEPTLELSLIPGRAGSLLLRLRERSSGATRSYSLRLPEALPQEAPQEALPEAAPQAPPEAPRPRSSPGRRKTGRRPEAALQGGRREARFRRPVIGLVLVAVLLAIAAVLVFWYTPLRKALAVTKRAVGVASATEAAQGPAQPLPPVPAVLPEGTEAGAGSTGAADSMSGDSARLPAAQADEPSAPARNPGPAVEPEPPAKKTPAEKSVAEKPAETLSYRVQWGDTLWQITEQYYGNPYLYSFLAGENAIVDPDLIIPGTELRLPPRIDDRDRK